MCCPRVTVWEGRFATAVVYLLNLLFLCAVYLQVGSSATSFILKPKRMTFNIYKPLLQPKKDSPFNFVTSHRAFSWLYSDFYIFHIRGGSFMFIFMPDSDQDA